MIAQIVYILCGLTSILCAALLYRQYRVNRAQMLFWSTWCFACIALTNILLFADVVLFPGVNLSSLRGGLMLAGMLMLIHGLIHERS